MHKCMYTTVNANVFWLAAKCITCLLGCSEWLQYVGGQGFCGFQNTLNPLNAYRQCLCLRRHHLCKINLRMHKHIWFNFRSFTPYRSETAGLKLSSVQVLLGALLRTRHPLTSGFKWMFSIADLGNHRSCVQVVPYGTGGWKVRAIITCTLNDRKFSLATSFPAL